MDSRDWRTELEKKKKKNYHEPDQLQRGKLLIGHDPAGTAQGKEKEMARVAPGIWDEKRLAILVPAVESSGQAVAMIWALLRQKLAARRYATRRE